MKFKPQIDDFDLVLIEGVETNIEKGIVQYDIPYADGAVCDDMGVMSRIYTFKTLWHNGVYKSVKVHNYNKYEEFLEHVSKRGHNHFVHPELGLIAGRTKNITVTHDRRKKCAEIEIEFIEDKGAEAAPTFAPELVSALENCFEDVVDAVTESTARRLNLQGFDTIKKWTGKVADFAKRVTAVTQQITNQINAGMNAINNAINTVMNPIESIVSLAVYAATLPGAIISSIARGVERAITAFNNIKNIPSVFMKSLKNGINNLTRLFKGQENTVKIMGAAVAAVEVGKLLVEDEEQSAIMSQIQNAPTQDGLQHTPPAPQVLTADDLNIIVAEMDELFEDAITAARDDESPAAVAALAKSQYLLQRFINKTMRDRERIITVNVETPMPLHAVLLRHGLPHSYADRIMLINNIQNPNFVQGEIRLYARPS